MKKEILMTLLLSILSLSLLACENKEEVSYIREQQIVTNPKEKNTLDKEEVIEKVNVRIVPYRKKKAICKDNLSTKGDILNELMYFNIEDSSGTFVYNQYVTSSNGVFDILLPKDKNYTLRIKSNGKSGGTFISTFENANSCINDIQVESESKKQNHDVFIETEKKEKQ